jgi:hypothetical protein
LLRTGGAGARGAIEDYFSTFADEMETFRLETSGGSATFDDEVIASIDAFLPYRNELVEVISTLARYWPFDAVSDLQRFFERVVIYTFKPASVGSWSEWDFDNYKFIAHELFLYTIAVLIKSERFGAVSSLLAADYYLGDAADDRTQPMVGFDIFQNHLRSLASRNQRLKLGRLSLHADILEKRSHSAGIPFRLIMQADFVLYLRSTVIAAHSKTRQWWPVTLVYATFRMRGPFELFARAQSASYFERIQSMFDVETDDEFRAVMAKLDPSSNAGLTIPRWEFDSIDPAALANLAKLATKP